MKKYKETNEPIEIKPLQVEVKDNFEDSFRKFKSLFQKEKIVSKVKEKMFYEKPSERKRRKKREAAERRFINDLRERQMASGEWIKRQKKKELKRQKKDEKEES